MASARARLQPQTLTNTHYSPKDKQTVCEPPVALSAVQTQVTLAWFQKNSLLNHIRLPPRNKKGPERGQSLGCTMSDQITGCGTSSCYLSRLELDPVVQVTGHQTLVFTAGQMDKVTN